MMPVGETEGLPSSSKWASAGTMLEARVVASGSSATGAGFSVKVEVEEVDGPDDERNG